MTNYNLEEFQAWLEEKSERKEATKAIDWILVSTTHQKNPQLWQQAVQGQQGLLSKYREIIQEWKTEVDQKGAERVQLEQEAEINQGKQEIEQLKAQIQNHLAQEKSFLQREIKLIKEVLHD